MLLPLSGSTTLEPVVEQTDDEHPHFQQSLLVVATVIRTNRMPD